MFVKKGNVEPLQEHHHESSVDVSASQGNTEWSLWTKFKSHDIGGLINGEASQLICGVPDVTIFFRIMDFRDKGLGCKSST